MVRTKHTEGMISTYVRTYERKKKKTWKSERANERTSISINTGIPIRSRPTTKKQNSTEHSKQARRNKTAPSQQPSNPTTTTTQTRSSQVDVADVARVVRVAPAHGAAHRRHRDLPDAAKEPRRERARAREAQLNGALHERAAREHARDVGGGGAARAACGEGALGLVVRAC